MKLRYGSTYLFGRCIQMTVLKLTLRECQGQSTLVPKLLWDPTLDTKSPTMKSLFLPQLAFQESELERSMMWLI